MGFNDLMEILTTLLPIVGISLFFFFYYKNERVKNATKTVLRFLPTVLSILASRVKDKPGVFDKHDMLILTGSLVAHIHETINDPSNANFDDVADDLFEFVRAKLDSLRDAGIKNVPDVNDDAIRTQIRVVFTSIQEAFSENTAGDDSQN